MAGQPPSAGSSDDLRAKILSGWKPIEMDEAKKKIQEQRVQSGEMEGVEYHSKADDNTSQTKKGKRKHGLNEPDDDRYTKAHIYSRRDWYNKGDQLWRWLCVG